MKMKMRALIWLMVFSIAMGAAAAEPYRVLIFNKTYKAYHDKAIPVASAALQALGPAHGFVADVNSDASVLTDAGLKPYKVIVFLNACGEVLDASQQAAFRRYIEGGGSFVGIHATVDCERSWPWFAGLIGAASAGDRHFEPVPVHVVDTANPSTAGLPVDFVHKDQYFRFKNMAPDLHLVLTVDGRKLTDLDVQDPKYPAAWYHTYDGGRAFFTSFGHEGSFEDPIFAAHILGAIRWASGE
jgi:type 1 glutamine amidotransferase